MHRPLWLAAIVVSLLLPTIASASEPLPFASASGLCADGQMTFPSQTQLHKDVLVHFQSLGASGRIGVFAPSYFAAGDSGWESYSNGENASVEAGTSSTVDFECSSGSVEAFLAERPSTPATFSGRSTPVGGLAEAVGVKNSYLPFTAPGAGQYVVAISMSQGAIEIEGISGILESSGEYSLGALKAGDRDIAIRAKSGPTAIWSATVRELPVVINKLTFGQQCVAPGTALPAKFSVTGDTMITADVLNSSGQVVRELGTFNVPEGEGSIPWDGRGAGGSELPNGLYTLRLVSTDPQGDSTNAQTSIYVADNGPDVSMTSPSKITSSQSTAFQISDPSCGVVSTSVQIDGKDRGIYGAVNGFTEEELTGPLPGDGSLVFAPPTNKGWSLGSHHWTIKAIDSAGMATTATGTFAVVSSIKHSNEFPSLLVREHPARFNVRPSYIDLWTTLWVGKSNSYPRLGRLTWRRWNAHEAYGVGTMWLGDGAQHNNAYPPSPCTVRASDVSNEHFTRLEIRQETHHRWNTRKIVLRHNGWT